MTENDSFKQMNTFLLFSYFIKHQNFTYDLNNKVCQKQVSCDENNKLKEKSYEITILFSV